MPAQIQRDVVDSVKSPGMESFLTWLRSLDGPFAFLVVLPFVVAAAAFLGEIARKHLDRKQR